MLICIGASSQTLVSNKSFVGTFSTGTRNTVSMFNEDAAIGKGIGGQSRIQFGKQLNTEWYFDYITSKKGSLTYRNDYHIGWSVMLYTKNNNQFDRLFQPYLIAGHCFDYSKVISQKSKSNFEDRYTMATQAGIGTHINITKSLDCSLSGQYMIHFGKDIETRITDGDVVFEKNNFSSADGHLLFTISFNYKFFHLWNNNND
jgi:hypothetical protein